MEEGDEKRLKAAIHYTVGKICNEEGTKHSLGVSRETVALLTELTMRQAEMLSHDLECFSQHAKRTTVTVDDVVLCARRNPSLQDHLRETADTLPGASKRKSKKQSL